MKTDLKILTNLSNLAADNKKYNHNQIEDLSQEFKVGLTYEIQSM